MPLPFAVGRGPAIQLGMVTAVVWAMFSAARVVYAKSRSPYIRFMFHIHNLRMFLAAVSWQPSLVCEETDVCTM